MATSVLLGYSTRYGSTKEVAEAIAAVLRDSGLEVKLERIQDVRSLEAYRAVVVGAPLYIGSWPGETKSFLAEHQAELAQRPLVVFALGPLSGDEAEMKGAREQLDKELAKLPSIKPVDVALFAGKFDPAKLHFPDNLLTLMPGTPLHKRPASDVRDWTAIRGWAASLAPKLAAGKPG